MTPDIGLANWFRQRALRSPERRALHFEGLTWTYAQMQRSIEDCAARLSALGVGKGERVAFLDDCAATALIVDARLRPVIEPERERLTSLKVFLAAEDEASWTKAPASFPEPVRVGEDDVAMILYTSGTTGRPKGAMLTHGNFWWNNVNGMHAIDCLADDITLTAAPVFHIGGLNVTTLVAFQKGSLVVLHRSFDPGRVLADIAANKVTTMFGVPAMFQFMAQHPAFAETDLSSVRLLIVGGAPCPLPVLKTYLARGVSMQQGYGLTETAPMVSFLAPEHALTKVGSSGRPPIFVDVKIVDSNGRTIETPGAQGEILIRGPNVTPGYWGLPQATALAIDKDGWFRTGDAGFFDEEGFLTISDRIKDMIITGGENVYPAEVESALMRHPAIAEVAVIGEPHEQWGEGILAIAALKAGQSLTLEALREFAGESLARYKLPGRLEIVPSLPRNATGKILKYQLRQSFAKAQGDQ
jgi:fatty-acyl-CoA synthase